MKIKISPLDKLFSEYIRRRAMQRVGGCERCLSGKVDYKQLQCSHFIGRGRKSTRYDEDNAVGLCMGCHTHLGANPLEHTQWFTDKIGQEKLDLLQARSRITYPKPDKKLIELYLKEKIAEILSE